MKYKANGTFLAMLAVILCGADWLQFRGRNGAGASRDAAPPIKWDDSTNIAWRVELPGRAASSPIVVKGRVVVTSSSGANQDRLHVLCFEVASGDEIWSRQFWATGRTFTHPFSAVAAPTPVSDGERIFAFYSSNDLVCLDLNGNLQWYRGLTFDYPKSGSDVGLASSPTVIGDTVVVQIESQGDSFAAGFNTENGETRWRIPRHQGPNWTSPIGMPVTHQGRHVVILQSSQGVTGHDARNGKELWHLEMPCATTPSAAVSRNRIYLPSDGLTVLDYPPEATTPSLYWQSNQLKPSPASPLVAGGRVYTVNSAGVLRCGDASDGSRLWQLRIGGRYWSTPVIAGSRIFCVNEDGVAKVVQLGDKGTIVATNKFDEPIKGSPALADGALYVRSDSYLWKIARP